MTLERLRVWLKALRVNQWTKNGIVFLAWFFAFADDSQAAMARGYRPFLLVSAMAVSFSLISSAFYLLNDVLGCVYEYQVMYGWNLFPDFCSAAFLDESVYHGYKTLYAFGLKILLCFEFPAVGGTHGKPHNLRIFICGF